LPSLFFNGIINFNQYILLNVYFQNKGQVMTILKQSTHIKKTLLLIGIALFFSNSDIFCMKQEENLDSKNLMKKDSQNNNKKRKNDEDNDVFLHLVKKYKKEKKEIIEKNKEKEQKK